MDVDARSTVSPLGKHSRDQRNVEFLQLVSDPVNGDRFQAWVAENDLVRGLRSGVAIVSRLHVAGQNAAQIGDRFEKLNRLFLSDHLKVGDFLFVTVDAEHVCPVSQCPRDLLSQ